MTPAFPFRAVNLFAPLTACPLCGRQTARAKNCYVLSACSYCPWQMTQLVVVGDGGGKSTLVVLGGRTVDAGDRHAARDFCRLVLSYRTAHRWFGPASPYRRHSR